ncbi:helix-turn-helix domain-containing protein [aff. Roholtiella sp. LEGE 12411]|uniref:helix-turn-helix domain-containing protein n=1 Tax=aff. Roholtiella sp. LEGE 12411 TaxID=1828822 RepID=UPI001882BFD6|nr:helix-turn-helix transcriptional regulator [aff. Roholtiella sp. LEGE 12411]MBE9035005.1 helix-turn-helix transcriptional regulator [aff. Roholtiella sp. LEGE 12411]
MKQLAKILYSRFLHGLQQILETILHKSNPSETKITEDEDFLNYPTAQLKKQIPFQVTFKKDIPKSILSYHQSSGKPQQFKKASLFPDGKTNIAALSLILHGVADVLSQKMNLSWKAGVSSTFSYEKEVEGTTGKIFYYVTDNPENPQPEALAEETALVVIDQFDPRACAIHLIYCALVANLDQPWEGNFVIDDRQLLEYTGLVKRRDLCKHEKLSILYQLLRQPAQILAYITWSKRGKRGNFSVADLRIWDVSIIRDFKTDKAGNSKLVGLKVIGQPGAWTKYFLNKSNYYSNTGIITKKTVQKLFSIGKQNAGAARILVWLTFQIQPGYQNYVMGKTLMEIAYGADKVSTVERDNQLRRQMADDFETDLKVVKEAGWEADLQTEAAWLISSDVCLEELRTAETAARRQEGTGSTFRYDGRKCSTKRPIGYWNELLNTKWHFHVPAEVEECLRLNSNQPSPNNIQPPTGNVIREARKTKGWSRAFFAATMGKSISWVDAVETGTRKVSQKDMPKLLNILELQLIS